MKFLTLIACVLFSGSMAFAHCGSCGTGEAKAEKHNCSKNKKSHKCKGKKCKKKHKEHRHTDGHKEEHHAH